MSQSRRIVVPVDFSEHSRVAAARACELARASSHGVHLVHAVRPPVVMAQEFAFPSDFWRVLRESARKEIDSLVESLDTEGLVFLGFQLPGYAALEGYRGAFPDDAALDDLGNWDRYEAAHPGTFANTFQPCCQTPECAGAVGRRDVDPGPHRRQHPPPCTSTSRPGKSPTCSG